MIDKKPRIALIGGGTGSFTLLSELKKLTPFITAIVNMSDDGGSTGLLRDELGVLPPGDIRQCLVALSDSDEVRDLFNFRFDRGALANQSLGNVILSGLELKHGSFKKAVEVASSVLHITGKVVPVTLGEHTLVMNDGDEVIKGEHLIGHRLIKNPGATVRLDPEASLNPEAQDAIAKADLVVIAPGNLYGSLLPALAVNGMSQAFKNSKAKKVVVANLVTKPGQTDNWHVVDYVKTLENYIGKNQIDFVLYNNEVPTKELLKKYASSGEFPVDNSAVRFAEIKAKAIGAKLVADKIGAQDPNDKMIKRTLIRHDGIEVNRQLMKLVGAK